MSLICLIDHIPFSISDIKQYFKGTWEHETIADNSPTQICINKIRKCVVFKIKTGYKLELLQEETMRFLGSRGASY